MTKIKSNKIIKKLMDYYGKSGSQLSFSGIFELTIAVILSAQTTDKQVNSVTPILFGKYPDFQTLAKAHVKDIESIIKSVGLYKTKARNILKISREVVRKYNNIMPSEFDELIKLPGIGRKSANVILSMGFNKPAFAVDTHVLRVANRIGYISARDPYKVEKTLTDFIPERYWIKAHLLMIKHGRNLCTARKPHCFYCPLNNLCDFVNISHNNS